MALLGVKNAFIANAAAAGAIPIVERIFSAGSSATGPGLDIVSALWWFGSGIVAAAITCLLAYLNFNSHAISMTYDIADDEYRLLKTHFDEEYSDADRKMNKEGEEKADRTISWTYRLAILTGISSYLVFGIGIFKAIPG
jgi:hypothetical protein